MPTIDAAGCKINVEIDGVASAPPLVISNSLGTNLHMWDEQAKALAKRYRVIRYDQRGHGKSGAPKGPYTIDRLGRDVLAILDHLEIKKTNFLGLSMGGTTGMWLACNAPHRFQKIILANTGPRIGAQDIWNARIMTVLDKGMKALVDATIERWLSKKFRDTKPPAIEKIRKMLLTTPKHGYAGCSAAIRDADFRWAIGGVKLPTLVIAGSLDPATPPEGSEFIAQRIARAKLVSLEAAHLSNIEQSAQFTRAVEDFLA
ncbi:MAG TPA: 3-oxoadipate enol-lactonase [Xanthobacteraceae bacterium]|jgi:3-oxoadipate enol-lactonase|nr:3-oxoadipate enol-lactonase [Xanthobacteraceae bacterium]